jgi:hypothetical protein
MNLIPADTTIEVMRKQLEILQQIGIEGRAEMTFQLSDKARKELIENIKKEHPEFTQRQVKYEVIRRCYGEELYREVIAAERRRD